MTDAVLDIGSNTIRLLVAQVRDGQIEPIVDQSEFVRLGRDVDKSGELRADRIEAGVDAIGKLLVVARDHGAKQVRGIATSAVRDARNGIEFIDRVQRETGLEIQIISGEEEADLTFLGAAIGVDTSEGVVVVDLGGGSAELIFANAAGIQWRRSEQFGSSRLTERFIAHDPPEASELEAVRTHVRQVLATLPPTKARAAVLTGGTASHLALLANSDQRMTMLDLDALYRIEAELAGQTATQIVAQYSFRPERAQVLPAGVAALTAIAAFFKVQTVLITRNGIREGTLLAAAEGQTDSKR